jgi:carbamoyl-phosphate synthase large subunit
MIYCFDLDGTICTKTEKTSYYDAVPFDEMVNKINRLYDEGHTIKVYTARGGLTRKDWRALTERQLSEWGVKHHELIMGKPAADYYIDDKAIHPNDFLGLKFRIR